jgi:hypothetical protein
MQQVPVPCEHCGITFSFEIPLEAGNPAYIYKPVATMCPHCKNPASLSIGIYYIVENTVSILHSPNASVDDINKLVRLLSLARDSHQKSTELAELIISCTPEFTPLAESISRIPNAFWQKNLHVLLTIVLMIIVQCKPNVDTQLIADIACQVDECALVSSQQLMNRANELFAEAEDIIVLDNESSKHFSGLIAEEKSPSPELRKLVSQFKSKYSS